MDFKSGQTAFLSASWLNIFLYTSEVCLAVYHLNTSKLSWNTFNRLSLTTSLVVDTACTAVVCYNVYLYLLDSQNHNLFLQPWTLPATIMLTYTSSLIEQTFFAHRYWRISRNNFMTLIVVLLIATHVVFGFIAGIWVAVNPQLEVNFGVTATTVAAVLCSATDLIIAVCMVWKLRSIQTSYSQTQSLIRRVSMQAVTSGIFTSTATIVMLILLFTSINGFYVLFASLGRLYTLTMLINYMVLRGHEETTRRTSRTPGTSRTGTTTDEPVVLTPIGFHSFTIPDLNSAQVSNDNVDDYSNGIQSGGYSYKSQTTRTRTAVVDTV